MGFNINRAYSWKSAHNAAPYEAIFDHISPYHRRTFLPLIKNNLTVVPLRHPYLTEKSWLDRKKDISDLIKSWEILADEIDPLEPYYLPLDAPDRQVYLDELNAATGRQMTTDWMPQGVVHNNHDLTFKDVSPSAEMEDLCYRIKPFLDGFYCESF